MFMIVFPSLPPFRKIAILRHLQVSDTLYKLDVLRRRELGQSRWGSPGVQGGRCRLQNSGPGQTDPEQTFPQRRYVPVQSATSRAIRPHWELQPNLA